MLLQHAFGCNSVAKVATYVERRVILVQMIGCKFEGDFFDFFMIFKTRQLKEDFQTTFKRTLESLQDAVRQTLEEKI